MGHKETFHNAKIWAFVGAVVILAILFFLAKSYVEANPANFTLV